MIDQSRWVEQINQRMEKFVSNQNNLLKEVSPLLEPFMKFSREFLSGGKRFRGQCVFLGFSSFERDIPPLVTDIASSLEIFHAAALVHDDIMDKSDTRRGSVSVHRGFEYEHKASAWTGDAGHFGLSSSLLFGDMLLAWSDQLFAEGISQVTEPSSKKNARNEFDRMRIDVTAGQYLDILEEHAWPTVQQNDRLTRAQHVALYKSAKYSIEAPLVIGASLAGASPSDIHTMRNIGVPLGIAFQLRDDLLGVFGDPAVTGKPAGDDLREGKRTVLIALAQKQLSKEQASRFDELLGNPNLTPEQIVSLQTSLVDCGAVEQLEVIITEQVHQAKSVINSYDFVPEIKEALNHLAEKVSQRSS